MKKMQSYIIMFYTLEHCYWICKEDALGALLGAMNPELMADGYPIDGVMLDVWWDDITKHAEITEDNYADYVYKFVQYYNDTVGFPMPETLKLVKNGTNARLYREALEYSEKLYAKYGYKD